MESNEMQPKKARRTFIYTFIVLLYAIVVKIAFFMRIEGKENVPKDRNCVLMGNHQCLLDPVTLALCVPDREIHFMGKKELFENKLLGWVFRCWRSRAAATSCRCTSRATTGLSAA